MLLKSQLRWAGHVSRMIGDIACPRYHCMVNFPLATVTEGHQRNIFKTPLRRLSVPATLTTTSNRDLLLTVRQSAASTNRSSPPLRTPSEPTSGKNAAGGRSKEPQQSYQTKPLTAVAAVGLAYPASAKSAISMPAVDVDSLLHKSSFAKSSQEGQYGLYSSSYFQFLQSLF